MDSINNLNIRIGKKLVQEIINKDDTIKWRRPRKGPWITDSHIKRLKWAEEWVRVGPNYWSSVM